MAYLDALLDNIHVLLKKAHIIGGDLSNYIRAEDLHSKAPYIKQLIFEYISINESILPKLSTDFSALDYLKFAYCQFRNTNGHIKIDMPETAINTLHVRLDVVPSKTVLLLSLCSMEKNISTYYFCADETDQASLISKSKYDLLERTFENHQECVLLAKTVKTFGFCPFPGYRETAVCLY